MIRVANYASFDELPSAYLPLFKDSAERSIFYDVAWFRNFTETALGEKDRVCIYGIELDDGINTPLAVLPARYEEGSGTFGRLRKLTSLSNYYSSLFGPVLRDTGPDGCKLMRDLARGVCQDSRTWDVIDLKPLDVASPLFDELVASFRAAGMVVQTYFCFGNWYLPVAGRSYRDYFESLPTVVKNTIRRKRKKLEQEGNARIEVITGHEGLEAAVQAYETVYAASWKVPEPHPLFVPGLVRTCARRGWLRLGLIYIDNAPVAAQLWIVEGRTASIFKLAYDERYASFSPGTLLTAQLMEYVLDVDKVCEVDYLTGDDSYKKSWMSHRRERWGIMAFNPRTLRGLVGITRHLGGRVIKGALRAWSSGRHEAAANSPEKTVARVREGQRQ